MATDREVLTGLVGALKAYVVEYGVRHLDGCPEDDTCDCALVLAVSKALDAGINQVERTPDRSLSNLLHIVRETMREVTAPAGHALREANALEERIEARERRRHTEQDRRPRCVALAEKLAEIQKVVEAHGGDMSDGFTWSGWRAYRDFVEAELSVEQQAWQEPSTLEERARKLSEALLPFALFARAWALRPYREVEGFRATDPALYQFGPVERPIRVSLSDCQRAAALLSPRDGRLFACAARGGVDPANPQDCDWPHCGCDPSATRVLNQLTEEGATIVTEAFLVDVGALLFDIQVGPVHQLETRCEELAQRLATFGVDHVVKAQAVAASTCDECGKLFMDAAERETHQKALREAADAMEHAFVDATIEGAAHGKAWAAAASKGEQLAEKLGTTADEIRKHAGKVEGQQA